MFVGATGVARVVQRTVDLMKEHDTDDVAEHGGIDVATLQRYLNFHYSVSLDLFGAETSTNAANYFAAGLKGRFQEEQRDDDHRLKTATRAVPQVADGQIGDARGAGAGGAQRDARATTTSPTAARASTAGTARWPRSASALELPHVGFNRAVGAFAGRRISPDGRLLTDEEWADGVAEWLPTDDDRALVQSLMVASPSRARWPAGSPRRPPASTPSPVDFEYVRL